MEVEDDDEAAFEHHMQNHHAKLLNNLYSQWRDEQYCDLIILTESKALPTHACVLSAFSPKIASYISKQNEDRFFGNNKSSVYMVEVKFSYEVMVTVVTALYTGVFRPHGRLLKDVLAAVKWLKLSQLVQVIKNHLDNDISAHEGDSAFFLPVRFPASPESCHPTLASILKTSPKTHKSDIENSSLEEIGEDNDIKDKQAFSDSVVQIVSTEKSSEQDRKHKHLPNALDRNIVIEIPRIDKVDQTTLDAIIKLEVDSPCVVNFDDLSSSAPPQERPQRTANSHKDRKSRKVHRAHLKSGNIPPRTRVKSSTKTRLQAVIESKKQKTSSSQKTEMQKEKVTAKRKVGRPKKERKGLHKEQKSENIQDKSLNTGGENLQAAVIEEVDGDDPVKEELDFLMGSIPFVKCKKCFQKFSDLNIYHEHVQNHPHYECPHCGRVFYRKFSLTQHVRSTHIGRPYLQCRHCDFLGKAESQLRKHSSEVHGDPKPFQCPHEGCSFRSAKYDRVTIHEVVHSEDKQFICDKCSLGFVQYRQLMSHQRACYQMQEFLCDLCGQSFNHEQSMRAHRRTIHFGERPYQCKMCSNSFSDHRNLKRHMRIHENIFPYSCPVCSQKFRHSNSLKAHVTSKHKDLPEDFQLKIPNAQPRNILGGKNYKRNLKNDHINTITSKVRLDGEWVVKKRSQKVKRHIPSPSQIYRSASFTGEFLIPPEDSNFDASNSDDLELVMDNAHHIESFSEISKSLDLHRGNEAAIEDDDTDIAGSGVHSGKNFSAAASKSVLHRLFSNPHFLVSTEHNGTSAILTTPNGTESGGEVSTDNSQPLPLLKVTAPEKSESSIIQLSLANVMSLTPNNRQEKSNFQLQSGSDSINLLRQAAQSGSAFEQASSAVLEKTSHSTARIIGQTVSSPNMYTNTPSMKLAKSSPQPKPLHVQASLPSPSHNELFTIMQVSNEAHNERASLSTTGAELKSWADILGQSSTLLQPYTHLHRQSHHQQLKQSSSKVPTQSHVSSGPPKAVQIHKVIHFTPLEPSAVSQALTSGTSSPADHTHISGQAFLKLGHPGKPESGQLKESASSLQVIPPAAKNTTHVIITRQPEPGMEQAPV